MKVGNIISIVPTIADGRNLFGIVVKHVSSGAWGVNWVAGGPRYRDYHPDFDCLVPESYVGEILGEIQNDT